MTFANPHKSEKLSTLLERLAAEFLARENPTSSLITVTGSKLSDTMRHIDIFVSVLPETDEKNVLLALNKVKRDFSEFIEKHSKISRIPSFDFKIDPTLSKQMKVMGIIEDIS